MSARNILIIVVVAALLLGLGLVTGQIKRLAGKINPGLAEKVPSIALPIPKVGGNAAEPTPAPIVKAPTGKAAPTATPIPSGASKLIAKPGTGGTTAAPTGKTSTTTQQPSGGAGGINLLPNASQITNQLAGIPNARILGIGLFGALVLGYLIWDTRKTFRTHEEDGTLILWLATMAGRIALIVLLFQAVGVKTLVTSATSFAQNPSLPTAINGVTAWASGVVAPANLKLFIGAIVLVLAWILVNYGKERLTSSTSEITSAIVTTFMNLFALIATSCFVAASLGAGVDRFTGSNTRAIWTTIANAIPISVARPIVTTVTGIPYGADTTALALLLAGLLVGLIHYFDIKVPKKEKPAKGGGTPHP